MNPSLIRTFGELVVRARRDPPPRMVVASAAEGAALTAAVEAARQGLVRPILIGSKPDIRRIAEEEGVDIGGMELVEAEDSVSAAVTAVRFIHEGRAELLMKGLVRTKDFLRAILSHEFGLRGSGAMSHVAVFESPDRSRLMMLTDSGINIRPRFNRKMAIVQNALTMARVLGIEEPRVAVIAAVETVELPTMPATLDAELLRRMAMAGRFGRCILDGPLSMDNALDSHTADVKGRVSPVAGQADIVVVPDIETGNAVYKTIRYVAGRDLAGAVVGAVAPAITTSRSDSPSTKLYSIALGVLMSQTAES